MKEPDEWTCEECGELNVGGDNCKACGSYRWESLDALYDSEDSES